VKGFFYHNYRDIFFKFNEYIINKGYTFYVCSNFDIIFLRGGRYMDKINKENMSIFVNKIALHKDEDGALSKLLHISQDLFNCVPDQVQLLLAKELNTSIGHISGVVSFYSYFSYEPRGKYLIDLCTGTACFVCGSKDVAKAAKETLGINFGETTEDGLFTLLDGKCLGHCSEGTSVRVNDELYTKVTADKIKEIISTCKGRG
jgi:NADH:ubiquinone oxidoreductase subunit E